LQGPKIYQWHCECKFRLHWLEETLTRNWRCFELFSEDPRMWHAVDSSESTLEFLCLMRYINVDGSISLSDRRTCYIWPINRSSRPARRWHRMGPKSSSLENEASLSPMNLRVSSRLFSISSKYSRSLTISYIRFGYTKTVGLFFSHPSMDLLFDWIHSQSLSFPLFLWSLFFELLVDCVVIIILLLLYLLIILFNLVCYYWPWIVWM
jgi:hypothetical protein